MVLFTYASAPPSAKAGSAKSQCSNQNCAGKRGSAEQTCAPGACRAAFSQNAWL